jgi:hypothetical protein
MKTEGMGTLSASAVVATIGDAKVFKMVESEFAWY